MPYAGHEYSPILKKHYLKKPFLQIDYNCIIIIDLKTNTKNLIQVYLDYYIIEI
jgi:hypothetical protein